MLKFVSTENNLEITGEKPPKSLQKCLKNSGF